MTKIDNNQITVYQGSITKLKTDAIVNAANKSLLGGAGVDGAIHRAAGKQLKEACRKLHGCHVGQAKITSGFNLPAKYVIHTVGPFFTDKPTDYQQLANCYRNSLNLAKRYQLHSIAFPAISTGVYHFPAQKAAEIAIKVSKLWLKQHSNYQMQITLCAFDNKTKQIYNKLLN